MLRILHAACVLSHAVAASSSAMPSPADADAKILLDSRLIPRIDMSWPLDKIVNAVSEAAASDGPGFFYLLNHGVSNDLLERTIAEVYSFYHSAQSADLKMAASSLANFGRWGIKGYTAPNSEGAYAKDQLTDVRPDAESATAKLNTRESYVLRYPEILPGHRACDASRQGGTSIETCQLSQLQNNSHPYLYSDYNDFLNTLGRTVASEMTASPGEIQEAARLFFASNPWPGTVGTNDQHDKFRSTVSEFVQEVYSLADRMFEVFEAAVLEEGQKFPREDGMTTFNLARYGLESASSESLGISDHTDWEMFTLLYPSYYKPGVGLCDAHGQKLNLNNGNGGGAVGSENHTLVFTGLQAWYDGRWIAVPHIPGAIILNQGEMLSRVSRNRFKAPVHRVRANAAQHERYSLVSFWGPNYDYLLPDRAQSGEERNVLAGEYYLKRNSIL
eukprot:TRINITY_DN48469_c0_g1_i2.p1 TRINITY_DN48469_c0_g1~~TRINITY_DN48469_c0_g1_i2.p1  ORF type:complete len:446 (-),score=30.94 TRINITY_DN48469_c0_g1_i2:481-1818(-)